jgi:hypothetical protein
MAGVRLFLISVAFLVAGGSLAVVSAQEGPGGYLNPQRDCQTLTTCQFKKNGSYRGCLSSYSCRVCKLVPVRCQGGRGKVCREIRCVWGA